MPSTIKVKNTANNVPNTLEMEEAEIAIDTATLKIYARDDVHNIVEMSGLYDGVGLPTTDPHLDGAFWNDNGVLKVSAG